MDLPLPRHQLQSWPCDVCKFDMLHVKHLKIHTCWGLEYVVTTSPLKTSNNYKNILNALNIGLDVVTATPLKNSDNYKTRGRRT